MMRNAWPSRLPPGRHLAPRRAPPQPPPPPPPAPKHVATTLTSTPTELTWARYPPSLVVAPAADRHVVLVQCTARRSHPVPYAPTRPKTRGNVLDRLASLPTLSSRRWRHDDTNERWMRNVGLLPAKSDPATPQLTDSPPSELSHEADARAEARTSSAETAVGFFDSARPSLQGASDPPSRPPPLPPPLRVPRRFLPTAADLDRLRRWTRRNHPAEAKDEEPSAVDALVRSITSARHDSPTTAPSFPSASTKNAAVTPDSEFSPPEVASRDAVLGMPPVPVLVLLFWKYASIEVEAWSNATGPPVSLETLLRLAQTIEDGLSSQQPPRVRADAGQAPTGQADDDVDDEGVHATLRRLAVLAPLRLLHLHVGLSDRHAEVDRAAKASGRRPAADHLGAPPHDDAAAAAAAAHDVAEPREAVAWMVGALHARACSLEPRLRNRLLRVMCMRGDEAGALRLLEEELRGTTITTTTGPTVGAVGRPRLVRVECVKESEMLRSGKVLGETTSTSSSADVEDAPDGVDAGAARVGGGEDGDDDDVGGGIWTIRRLGHSILRGLARRVVQQQRSADELGRDRALHQCMRAVRLGADVWPTMLVEPARAPRRVWDQVEALAEQRGSVWSLMRVEELRCLLPESLQDEIDQDEAAEDSAAAAAAAAAVGVDPVDGEADASIGSRSSRFSAEVNSSASSPAASATPGPRPRYRPAEWLHRVLTPRQRHELVEEICLELARKHDLVPALTLLRLASSHSMPRGIEMPTSRVSYELVAVLQRIVARTLNRVRRRDATRSETTASATTATPTAAGPRTVLRRDAHSRARAESTLSLLLRVYFDMRHAGIEPDATCHSQLLSAFDDVVRAVAAAESAAESRSATSVRERDDKQEDDDVDAVASSQAVGRGQTSHGHGRGGPPISIPAQEPCAPPTSALERSFNRFIRAFTPPELRREQERLAKLHEARRRQPTSSWSSSSSSRRWKGRDAVVSAELMELEEARQRLFVSLRHVSSAMLDIAKQQQLLQQRRQQQERLRRQAGLGASTSRATEAAAAAMAKEEMMTTDLQDRSVTRRHLCWLLDLHVALRDVTFARAVFDTLDVERHERLAHLARSSSGSGWQEEERRRGRRGERERDWERERGEGDGNVSDLACVFLMGATLRQKPPDLRFALRVLAAQVDASHEAATDDYGGGNGNQSGGIAAEDAVVAGKALETPRASGRSPPGHSSWPSAAGGRFRLPLSLVGLLLHTVLRSGDRIAGAEVWRRLEQMRVGLTDRTALAVGQGLASDEAPEGSDALLLDVLESLEAFWEASRRRRVGGPEIGLAENEDGATMEGTSITPTKTTAEAPPSAERLELYALVIDRSSRVFEGWTPQLRARCLAAFGRFRVALHARLNALPAADAVDPPTTNYVVGSNANVGGRRRRDRRSGSGGESTASADVGADVVRRAYHGAMRALLSEAALEQGFVAPPPGLAPSPFAEPTLRSRPEQGERDAHSVQHATTTAPKDGLETTAEGFSGTTAPSWRDRGVEELAREMVETLGVPRDAHTYNLEVLADLLPSLPRRVEAVEEAVVDGATVARWLDAAPEPDRLERATQRLWRSLGERTPRQGFVVGVEAPKSTRDVAAEARDTTRVEATTTKTTVSTGEHEAEPVNMLAAPAPKPERRQYRFVMGRPPSSRHGSGPRPGASTYVAVAVRSNVAARLVLALAKARRFDDAHAVCEAYLSPPTRHVSAQSPRAWTAVDTTEILGAGEGDEEAGGHEDDGPRYAPQRSDVEAPTRSRRAPRMPLGVEGARLAVWAMEGRRAEWRSELARMQRRGHQAYVASPRFVARLEAWSAAAAARAAAAAARERGAAARGARRTQGWRQGEDDAPVRDPTWGAAAKGGGAASDAGGGSTPGGGEQDEDWQWHEEQLARQRRLARARERIEVFRRLAAGQPVGRARYGGAGGGGEGGDAER